MQRTVQEHQRYVVLLTLAVIRRWVHNRGRGGGVCLPKRKLELHRHETRDTSKSEINTIYADIGHCPRGHKTHSRLLRDREGNKCPNAAPPDMSRGDLLERGTLSECGATVA